MGCSSSEPSYVTQVVLHIPSAWKAYSDSRIYEHVFLLFMGPDMMKLSEVNKITSAVHVPGGEIASSFVLVDVPVTEYRERQRLSHQAIRFVDHISPGIHTDTKSVLSNSICFQTYDIHLNRTKDHLEMRIMVHQPNFNATRAGAFIEMTKRTICKPTDEHPKIAELYKSAMATNPIAHVPHLRQQILAW